MSIPAGNEVPDGGPAVIFDLESLLVDAAEGVRHALAGVIRACRASPARVPLNEVLRSSTLGEVIAGIAGSDDPARVSDLAAEYRRVYDQDSRYRAPLLPGAGALLATLRGLNAELHYVSTLGPQASMRLVQRHSLNRTIDSVYTPSLAICINARSSLLESFIETSTRAPGEYLLLSDTAAELCTAQRLGIPALAIGYGRTRSRELQSLPGVLGVAESPAEVGHWLRAGFLARHSLRCSARRGAARLH